MEVIFSLGAREDIKNSILYYENEVDGLGKAFYETVKSSRIVQSPYRRHLTRRFPFGIIYRIENHQIFIAAVMHLKKRPYYWLGQDKQTG